MNASNTKSEFSPEEELNSYKETEKAFETLAASLTAGISPLILGRYRECTEHLQRLLTIETNPNYLESLKEVQCTIEGQQKSCRSVLYAPQGSYSLGESSAEVRKCKKLKDFSISLPRPEHSNTHELTGIMKQDNVEKQSTADSCRKEALLSTARTSSGGTLLSDIAGLDHVKSVLRKSVLLPLQCPSLFTGRRKTWNHILLYGPPGTGKSKIAAAIANESQLTLFAITSADLLSSWVGESEKTIKDLFEMARSVQKTSIVFIDEIDSVCRRRNDSEADYSRRVKNQLLIEMDNNLSSQKSCVLLCATNCPWDLDAAFIRRFQCRLYAPLPGEAARLQILQDQCRGVGVNMSDDDWKCIVKHTEGYSGADLTNLAMYAIQEPIGELEFRPAAGQRYETREQPSSSTHVGSSREVLSLLPLDTVEIRDVKLHDFIKALHATSKSVTPAQLQKFQSFMEQSG